MNGRGKKSTTATTTTKQENEPEAKKERISRRRIRERMKEGGNEGEIRRGVKKRGREVGAWRDKEKMRNTEKGEGKGVG